MEISQQKINSKDFKKVLLNKDKKLEVKEIICDGNLNNLENFSSNITPIFNNLIVKMLKGERNENKIKISIIIVNYDRFDLLLLTLVTLNTSSQNNFEVIIIDRSENSNIYNIEKYDFKFYVNIIKLDKNNLCSDILKKCKGKTIVIQNQDCIHFNDNLSYIEKNFKYDDYFIFPCYTSNDIKTNNYIIENFQQFVGSGIQSNPNLFRVDKKFCTVISKEYLKMLGELPLEYLNDCHCEDKEMLFNISEILKLNIINIRSSKNVGVIHMYHGTKMLNNPLFKEIKNDDICIPKIFHYYWDDFKKFSYMNLYSLKTCIHYHSDYTHIIWCPKYPQKNITWEEDLNAGFSECFRVLKNSGTLIFKWNETQIKTREILALTDRTPTVGHISGKQANTHWITFLK